MSDRARRSAKEASIRPSRVLGPAQPMAAPTARRVPSAAADDEILDEQADDILGQAVDVGRERLGRTPLDIVITAVIGGVEVSLAPLPPLPSSAPP